jgi:predicted RND superfamily exporter protein
MLCFSQFVPTVYFGLFTGLAILMGLFASLTPLPASFLLLRYPRRKATGHGPQQEPAPHL